MTTATKNYSTTATWSVICKDHDCGAADVDFIRKTEKDAERSANLFRQCGYRNVTVKQFAA
jgi:hypothetical protein